MQETQFDPWLGKIPHASEQPGLWATATGPACCSQGHPHAPEPKLCNERGHCSEKPVCCIQRAARAAVKASTAKTKQGKYNI